MLSNQPLGLYVHLPWCVSKCPYCDFNSHALKGDLPAEDYCRVLLADLENDLHRVWGRTVHSIFFGGGTPSLFSAGQFEWLLTRIRALLPVSPGAEITLEANPGTVEHDSFTAYRQAGINRVSLGAQSFDDAILERIGRIHAGDEIERAVAGLRAAGMENFNLDLMYGLPGQSTAMAVADVERALSCGPAHISHYQLTLEPNTAFAAQPPKLPGEEKIFAMQEACGAVLAQAGFANYEISAWARAGRACRHNLNYWRFGDYLGIGAGAHAKLSMPAEGRILRLARHRHPRRYLAALETGDWLAEVRELEAADRVFEYFLNAVRLAETIVPEAFTAATGLPFEAAAEGIGKALESGLLETHEAGVRVTALGRRFNNDLQALFLP